MRSLTILLFKGSSVVNQNEKHENILLMEEIMQHLGCIKPCG